MKQKFDIIESRCIPLPLENVDTDQIIPARFLKATSRDEKFFGDNLFRDWRYNPDGSINKDFVLNDPTYSGEILVAGKNFGSGSSREHAAWAIAGYGFRVVISSFFADIHKNNELNNFVLPVTVSEEFLAELFDSIRKDPAMTVRVDVPERLQEVLPDECPRRHRLSPGAQGGHRKIRAGTQTVTSGSGLSRKEDTLINERNEHQDSIGAGRRHRP